MFDPKTIALMGTFPPNCYINSLNASQIIVELTEFPTIDKG